MYGVKVIYKYEVSGEVFYEEQILKVQAASFDEAYSKALEYAKNSLDHHRINISGEKVAESVIGAVDCYLADDDNAEVSEIYSGIKKNRTALTENEFIGILGDCCDSDEMKVLRYR